MARPTVVLDTSVVVSDPEVWSRLGGEDVVVPLAVVLGFDKLQTRQDAVGANARAALRALEELRVSNGGSLTTAIALAGDSSLCVRNSDDPAASGCAIAASGNDNRILAAVMALQAERGSCRLISSDVSLRILASQLGLRSSDHVGQPKPADIGWTEIDADPDLICRLYEQHAVPMVELPEPCRLAPNRFAVLKAGSASVAVRSKDGALATLRGQFPWGLKARSLEQRFALELLCDPDVPLVALTGRSGTGKTILSLAAGLHQTLEEDHPYDHLAIFRPIIPVGRAELGFLPGEQNAKLAPWMSAIEDQLTVLSPPERRRRPSNSGHKITSTLESYQMQGVLTCESVTYLRGRSLHRHFVIVDEAQNLSRATVKTILTRAAEGSKIVLLGDINQIDDPYLSAADNGLVALLDAFSGQDCFGHLALQRCERAKIADLADKLL